MAIGELAAFELQRKLRILKATVAATVATFTFPTFQIQQLLQRFPVLVLFRDRFPHICQKLWRKRLFVRSFKT